MSEAFISRSNSTTSLSSSHSHTNQQNNAFNPSVKPVPFQSFMSEDTDIDLNLRVTNYEDVVRQLDVYYGHVKRKILSFQGASLGLFPATSKDKKIADVRTSVYCAMAVWALYQAYRRIDDDRGRSHELSQSAVKCMRATLLCWMRQATQVEEFKQNQKEMNALHSRFNLEHGGEIPGGISMHLQIDVVSLYLLTLTQMITSGLQIIYSMSEVNFIQNLVYYVERAYRTADYGMWERGNKYNTGTPEIHASSVGAAKAALEAINGLNLYGDKGSASSVIYVDIDAHNRNRSIFEALLPRESSSKNTDAALIPTISFPAFATHDERIIAATKTKVVRKLRGHHGFKRFLRDGYGTALEDPSRKYYLQGETKEFENIECEWPMFFAYMLIDGVFRNDRNQVREYQALLKPRMKRDKHGDMLMPMFYYVPYDCVSYEKAEPNSQPRVSSSTGGSADDVFLWGQSIYIISQLLFDGLLQPNGLDPIRRYLPSYNRPRQSCRYSAFQGTASDLVVQVVLFAESIRLQAMMATYGIQTQTPHEIEPVQIWSPSELVKVYKFLGVDEALGLTGRPGRPIGSLGTSKVYRISGQTVVCYPLIFEVTDFYLSHDMALLIDDIRTELHFVGKNWRLSGRPTVCILIREDHMRDPKFTELLDLLAQLKGGECDGLKVRTGRLQNLLASSCIEHLDFYDVMANDMPMSSFQQLQHKSLGYQSLTDIPKAMAYKERSEDLSVFEKRSTPEVVDALRNVETLYGRSVLLGILLKREGGDFLVDDVTVNDRLRALDHQAGSLRSWKTVRYCSSLFEKLVHSVSPSITSILVQGKQIAIGGSTPETEVVLDKPLAPGQVHSVFYQQVARYCLYQAALQQEVILYAGKLISTTPSLFQGIIKFRVGWVLTAMEIYRRDFEEGDNVQLVNCSPSEIRKLLYKVLTIDEWAEDMKLSPFQRRQLEGCLGRVPPDFYLRVWQILSRSEDGITVCNELLPSQPTLSSMTMNEHNFAILVEGMMSRILHPEYRQVLVECVLSFQLIIVMSTILHRNPELSLKSAVDLDLLVQAAHGIFVKEVSAKTMREDELDMTAFYSLSYAELNSYLARATVNHMLTSEQISDSPCRVS
ncbi:unnamed protein product [Cyprideis torosa]|uniref:Phosphorylase b kinase regulatory subunit n=1 Tax=Cyprideis torosa TaxID=163714 RepID=A0A7R8W8J1_9CRUS|nr:unnamed protein product [Cyprideis torosa]CAG0883522.1 unnamed protein product [Cyprideis torosa]